MGLFHPRATSPILCLQTRFTPAHTFRLRYVSRLRGYVKVAKDALVPRITRAPGQPTLPGPFLQRKHCLSIYPGREGGGKQKGSRRE